MIKQIINISESEALAPNKTSLKPLFPILLLSSIFFLFVGCGDNVKESKKSETVADASKIEVVANENAKEVKVAVKKNNGEKGTFYTGMTNNVDLKHGYDPNSQPANEDASVRIKPRTAIEANMNIRSPYEEVKIGLLVGELSKHFRVKCSACHSDYANGVVGPSLLGKSSDDIFNAIADFKSGKKSNPLMDGLIDHMEDSEIREIADEIYTFNQKLQEMRSK